MRRGDTAPSSTSRAATASSRTPPGTGRTAPPGPVTVWCGNDYLGMGQHPAVLAAMHEAIDAVGAGSGGTRNISGTTIYHKRLEAELADLHGKEAALLFTSAYIANDATLSTLPKLFPGLIIYSDALNHASMIEGIRRNGGARRIFRHNDVAHLRELLAADDPAAPKLIAFESVYSMDGDFGPIGAICDLAARVRRADLPRRGPCRRHVRPARRRHGRAVTGLATGSTSSTARSARRSASMAAISPPRRGWWTRSAPTRPASSSPPRFRPRLRRARRPRSPG